jgi:hypothetical protein
MHHGRGALFLALLALCAVSAPVAVATTRPTANASASVDGIELSVECRSHPGILRDCSLYEPIYAVLKSSADIDYVVCHPEPVPYPEHCTEPQNASAGTASSVPADPALGTHLLTWRYAATGVEIGSLQYSVEKPPGILHAGGASDQFTDGIREQRAGAFFPQIQRYRRSCPRVYVRPSGRIAVCFAEYKTAGRWHLARGVENIPPALNDIVLKVISDKAWQRRTKRCALPPGVPGTLISNNGCGHAMPYSDSQLVTGQLLPDIRAGKPFEEIRWKPILGPSPLAIFSGHRIGSTLRFNNEVGDWFAYTP